MKKSKLQFKNPRLRKLEFEINPNFNNENLLGLDLNSKVSIDRTNNKAIVSLLLNIFEKENLEDVPFFIDIEMSGEFKWSENVDEKTLDILLNSNAPAI